MTESWCWGFHASEIPVDSVQVVDRAGQLWTRINTRIWQSPESSAKHERWLLQALGPVRCPVEFNAGLPLTIRSTRA